MNRWIKTSLWIVVLVLLGLALVRAFRPMPVLVDLATIGRGTLIVSVDDDGRTRVRERYLMTAPLDGWLLRVPLDPGAPVVANTTQLAEFEALDPSLLDARAQAEAEARVGRAQAAISAAHAHAGQAEAAWEFARTDRERSLGLLASGHTTRQDHERAELAARQAEEALRAARFAVQVAEHDLRVTRAALLPNDSESGSERRRLPLFSPVDGTVLRVFEESARPVAAGTRILEVGSTDDLEVVADYLSQEAVRIQPGMPVRIKGWGGLGPDGGESILAGRVRLVEPAGYTKLSALGVEEQRVDVIVDPAEPLAAWAPLGDNFRVELEVVCWSADDVLIVPTGALFRVGADWAVFVVEGERAEQRLVTIGHTNGLEAELLAGLEAGARVVLFPSELIEDGARVEAH